jgi:hypothetical protein
MKKRRSGSWRMPLGVVTLEAGGLVIARHEHALLAERLDALVVAVGRTEARVDVRERTASHRQHHHCRVGVAMRILLRAEHHRGARDHLDRLVAVSQRTMSKSWMMVS